MAKTWKELNAEGVKRCCAYVIGEDGKSRRCRRRAADQTTAGFCAKHGPKIQAAVDDFLKHANH